MTIAKTPLSEQSEKHLVTLLRQQIQSNLSNRFEVLVRIETAYVKTEPHATSTEDQFHVWIIDRTSTEDLFDSQYSIQSVLMKGITNVATNIVEGFINHYVTNKKNNTTITIGGNDGQL